MTTIVKSTGLHFLCSELPIEMIPVQSLWHIIIRNRCMSQGLNQYPMVTYVHSHGQQIAAVVWPKCSLISQQNFKRLNWLLETFCLWREQWTFHAFYHISSNVKTVTNFLVCVVCKSMHVVYHSNFAAYIVCRCFKPPCEFLRFILTKLQCSFTMGQKVN